MPIRSAEWRNGRLDSVSLSPFDDIDALLAEVPEGDRIPLHQGKPCFTSEVLDQSWEQAGFPGRPHLDTASSGIGALLEAIAQHREERSGYPVDPGVIQVTNGITHGLSVAAHVALEPGDEVLVLSPHWLFTPGVILAAGGVPVEVPFFDVDGEFDDLLAPHVRERTRAVYFNAPNNPTGRSLSWAGCQRLVAFAERHGLWIFADNAYEFFDFTPEGWRDIACLDGAAARTFSLHSFSKSYGLTGYRVGYVVAPGSMADAVRKFSLHTIYTVSTASQFAAFRALGLAPAVMEDHRRMVAEARRMVEEHLRLPHTRIDGGFYTLVDLGDWAGPAGDFVAASVRRGVSLAPGTPFGSHLKTHARICFTSVDLARLKVGIDILNDIYLHPHRPWEER